MFMAMYDATGIFLKIRRGGGAGDDLGQAVAFDGSGNVIVGGSSSATATFGGTALANAGGKDAFFAKVTFFDPWFAASDHESTAGGQCFIQFQRGIQCRCEQQCASQLPMAIQWQPARRTDE